MAKRVPVLYIHAVVPGEDKLKEKEGGEETGLYFSNPTVTGYYAFNLHEYATRNDYLMTPFVLREDALVDVPFVLPSHAVRRRFEPESVQVLVDMWRLKECVECFTVDVALHDDVYHRLTHHVAYALRCLPKLPHDGGTGWLYLTWLPADGNWRR